MWRGRKSFSWIFAHAHKCEQNKFNSMLTKLHIARELHGGKEMGRESEQKKKEKKNKPENIKTINSTSKNLHNFKCVFSCCCFISQLICASSHLMGKCYFLRMKSISFVPFNLNGMFWKRHQCLKVACIRKQSLYCHLNFNLCLVQYSVMFVLWHLIEMSSWFFSSICFIFIFIFIFCLFTSLFSMRAHTIQIQSLLNQSKTRQVASETRQQQQISCHELEAHKRKLKSNFEFTIRFKMWTNRHEQWTLNTEI